MILKLPALLFPPQMTFWQALQGGMIPAIESEAYLAWVRTLPSVISGRTGCVAHHLVGHGLKGKGVKVSDLLTMPLHPDEHTDSRTALHVLGSPDWEQRNDDQRIYVLRTLVEAIYRGVLGSP